MKRKKPHHFSANIRNVSGNNKIPLFFRAFALRGSAAPPAVAREPRGAPVCGARGALRAVLCRAVTNRVEPSRAVPSRSRRPDPLTKRLLIAVGWVLGGRSAHASPFQAIVPQQSLILFTARGLWIYARFPSANDMRRDPLQLLLKCIRDIGSAERDGPCLSPGEN